MVRSPLLSTLCALLLASAAAAGPVAFLTGPQGGEPQQLALDYLATHHGDFGLTAADISDYVISDAYTSQHNGITHVYLIQRHQGIEVFAGMVNINVARDGSIINLGNRFVADLAAKANTAAPAIGAEKAVESAARHLGLDFTGAPPMLKFDGGPARLTRFAGDGLSRSEIPAKLVWQPVGDGVRLAWNLQIDMLHTADIWDLRIDAESGEFLAKGNWTDYHGGDEELGASFSYRVVPIPFESVEEAGASHSLEVDPHDATASPFGWHDTDGDIDPDFTDTRGNNVFAQDDTDGNNSGGSRPSGGAGPSLTFDFAFDDDATEPWEGTNLDAAIVNLFYWNNISHDWLYQYGFDETAGNFQQNNYGNGGNAGDPVQADAQDNADAFASNNANFSTPADGFDGRMQMFIFRAPPTLTITAPGSVAGDYTAGSASFGGFLTQAGLPGPPDLELVDDGTLSGSEGCNALVGFTPGRVAVIDRGSCEFGVKVLNAETAGAAGAIVINNQGDDVINMGGGAVGDQVTISSVFIGQTDGTALKNALTGNTVTGSPATTQPNRDSDMDSMIVVHEYGHGLSNRLTGGPSQIFCLGNAEQMGEGWSDYVALEVTAKAGDTPQQIRGMGPYAVFQDPYDGVGIRNRPYTTDFGINEQTYADVGTTNVPHGVGEIWAQALWDLHWDLIGSYGFDSDLYNGTGGNNLAMQLVSDGMKLQPCSPTFVEGRDAILLADLNNNGGANECAIWRSFAKRGVGVSAVDNGNGVGGETEAFDIPAQCSADVPYLFLDGFESGDATAWTSSIP